ncbi:hypothetical protein [Brevibacillus sp. BC25]|nr:hypothetical protein [Brevibacillus sp. BC25]EJL29932.1 hypothetical protein PMI05_01547 [Brevibacillus sp. BC25]
MSFNHYIWKYLFDRKLRPASDIEAAYQKGILTREERDAILGAAEGGKQV